MVIRTRPLALAWLLCCASFANAAAPLEVLLTNDDGYDAPGLAALHRALQDAGCHVTVVAPLRQQSGSGVRVTLGELNYAERSAGVWAVEGSPADAVAVGLTRVLSGARPDLVISGANLGQNLGANVVSSGTVGAAVMAVQMGVPAIAVSVGLDLAEAQAQPTPFPSTVAAYPLAGEVVVRLVQRLAAAAEGGRLLPGGVVLNLNLPARPRSAIAGVVLAPLGEHGGFRLDYPARAPGKARSVLTVDEAGTRDGDRDTARFAQGFITLSVLRADWNAAPAAGAPLVLRLGTPAALLPAAPAP